MKGLLLKEFYLWLRTRSFFILMLIVSAILWVFTGAESIAFWGALIGASLNSFILDEKSGWLEYSKALPCTPFQRVSSKYIFTFCEIMTATLIMSAATMIASITNSEYRLGFTEASITAISEIAAAFLLIAFTLPVCISVKGSKLIYLAIIPTVLIFYGYFFLYFKIRYNLPGWIEEAFKEKFWIYPVIILLSLGILVVSLMISVIIESHKSKKYRKKFAIKAVSFFTATIVLFGASFAAFYFSGGFPDPTFGDKVSSSKIKKAKEEFYPYYDFICSGDNIGKSYDECVDTLESIGFADSENNSGVFFSKNFNIKVYAFEDLSTGFVKRITATTLSPYKKIIKNASYADFEKAGSNFTVGMTEKELHQKIKEMEIIPSSITEHMSFDSLIKRNYYFSFSTDNYSSESEFTPAVYSVSVEVCEGKVINVETSVYEGTTIDAANDIATRQLLAKEEMRLLLNSYCNTDRTQLTLTENAHILGGLGFTRSDEESYVFTAESGNIKVRITPIHNREYVDYIHIGGGVGENRIEKATSEQLEKISGEFAVGMSTDKLHQKFYELDILPYSVFENSDADGNHTRNYKVLYIIESYNGGESTNYRIDIEVSDEKITNVTAIDS